MSDGSLALRATASTGVWSADGTREDRSARFPLAREALLLAALFVVYRIGRGLVEGDTQTALTNARSVWDLERLVFLPNELTVQQWALQWPGVVAVANWYYAILHLPTMVLLLAWGWWRLSASDYLWVRQLIVRLTGTSFVIFALMPLAPPRLTTELGFIDTVAIMGPSAYEETSVRLANQFAAMPSLHVGWALLLAVVVVATTRSRLRWMAAAHPVVMTAVVVVTANHFWLDAVVVGGLLLLVLRLTRRPAQAVSRITINGFVVGCSEPPAGSTVTPIDSPMSRSEMSCSTVPSLPRSRTPTDLAESSPSSPITHS